MSTTQPTRNRTFRQRWADFWFAPGDPTMLGFIRIVAGVLVVYLHLSYTVDLYRFFGQYGWYGEKYINRDRREYPWVYESAFKWDENVAMAQLPEYPHRKKAVLEFVRGLPADKTQRAAALRYLSRLTAYDSAEATRLGLQYVWRLPDTNEKREQELARLVNDPTTTTEQIASGVLPVPTYFRTLAKDGPDSRTTVAEEIRAFLAVLPPLGAIGDNPREFVLKHLMEMDIEHLKAFNGFLLALPDDPTARREAIDYLEYWNVDPSRVQRTGHHIFSIWFHIDKPNAMMAAHLGIIAVMVLFTAGFYTRVTSVVTWLAALSYIHRSQQVLFGMDTMMSILLFYLMIGNCGAALSVDRWLQKRRAIKASLARSGSIDEATKAFLANPAPSVSAGLALRLIQVHFCFIYMASGMSKLKGAAWWNGNAIWDVLVNPEFTLLRYPWYEWALKQLAEVKPLYYAFIAGGAWFTLFLELGTPFLIWTRLRPWMVLLATLLHAGIGILMGLNLFELMMMAMLLAYIPGCVVREWLAGTEEATAEPGAKSLPKLMGRAKPMRAT